MPLYDVKCPACGQEQVDVWAGMSEVVICACGSPTERIWRTRAIIGDEWPGGGGRWIENLDHSPVWCENKRALAHEMDKRGLRHPDRYVPGDKHLSNWGTGMDPYTLAAATSLVSRGTTDAEPAVVCETLQTYQGPPR